MASALEVIKHGATRRTIKVLEPGVYPWNDQLSTWKAAAAFVELKRRHRITRVEKFDAKKAMELGREGWELSHYELDTLQVIPRWWERVLAFVTFRRQPVARAIVINIPTDSK